MSRRSSESRLKDRLGGNGADPGAAPDLGWEQEPRKERFSWTETHCRC